MGALFTTRGRLSRRQYVIATLVILLITYAFAFAIGFASGVSGGDAQNAGMWGMIVGLVGCALQALLAVRRFHDLGKPGWHFWLLLIPFYNIYLSLMLCFTKGSSSPNEYGPAPA
jgi:uncharacterized membrane protein YhaH (DUF805 family)